MEFKKKIKIYLAFNLFMIVLVSALLGLSKEPINAVMPSVALVFCLISAWINIDTLSK